MKTELFLMIGFCPAIAVPGDEQNLDQHQLNVQAAEKYHAAGLRLEKVFKEQLSAARTESQRRALIASQKAWIAYREAEIAAKFPEDDQGSGTLQVMNNFARELTEERIHVLIEEM